MSAVALRAADQLPRHPGLIVGSVVLASLIFSIDWTIAVVALPHMQGAFSATQDQIGWVITSYIVASAMVLATAGWLSARFGRKRVFLAALIGFTAASVVCGAADSLEVEVLARFAQGMCGAFIIPISHAIILDTYPPEQQGRGMALWGMGTVSGSMIGPTLGGFLTEHLSWRYIFYINIPLGALALAGSILFVSETKRDPKRRLDWLGFLSLAVGIGAFQLMLDRGLRLDWFDSNEILIEATLAGMCLYLFAVHSLTTRNPFLDPRLILNRDFFLSLLLVSGYGFLTVPPIVLMPAFLEHIRGHEIEAVGMLQSPRGLGMLFAMFISGRIAGKYDPRISIACGLMCLMVTNWEMSRWNTDVGEWPIIWTGLLQGLGGGIMLVPIQMIAFPTLAPEQRTEATAVYNLVRNTIASVGVSVTLTLFVIASGTARSNFVQYITPYREALHYQEAARFKTDTQHGLAVIDKEIDKQAAMMGYNASFLLLAAASAAGLPVLFMFSRKSRALRHSVSRREAPALVAE